MGNNREQPSAGTARAAIRQLILFFFGGLLAFSACRNQDPEYRGKSLEYWEAQLRAKNEKDRQRAMDALSEMGRDGVPALVELLETADRKVCKQVVKVLVEMQVGATVEIGEWAAKNEEALKILEELCVQEQDDGYFIALAEAGPDAVPNFERLVQNDDRTIAWKATMALEQMVPPEEAVPVLRLALKNPHREVRERAAESLRACLQED